MPRASIQGLEVSVLWYTEGKGDEDLAVHYFHRWSAARLEEMDLSVDQRFATRLPASPFTYNGTLFRIRWCARMRLFRSTGRDLVTEQPFTVLPLDMIPPAGASNPLEMQPGTVGQPATLAPLRGPIPH